MHFAWRRGERGQRGMGIGGHERRRVKRERGYRRKGKCQIEEGLVMYHIKGVGWPKKTEGKGLEKNISRGDLVKKESIKF